MIFEQGKIYKNKYNHRKYLCVVKGVYQSKLIMICNTSSLSSLLVQTFLPGLEEDHGWKEFINY